MKITTPTPKTATAKGLCRLAFLLNYIVGHRCPDLPMADVEAAAAQKSLLRLLARTYGHVADFYYLLRKTDHYLAIEKALSHAQGLLGWRRSDRVGVSGSGLCLAMAIALEALQHQLLQTAPGHESRTTAPALRHAFQRISTCFKAFQRISKKNFSPSSAALCFTDPASSI